MDQAALPTQIGEYSQSKSVWSSKSLLESTGSVESWNLRPMPTPNSVNVESGGIESWKLSSTPTRTPEVKFRRPRKNVREFMHFSKALLNVPVQVVWDMISDHRNLTSLVPGVMESFDYVEGEGAPGSVYVAMYFPQFVKPGERKYQMNEVQVCDEASKLYAVKSVGGKYQQRYSLYTQYIRVHADEVLGPSSSVVECHFEFELRNQASPLPVDSGNSYKLVISKIRDKYQLMNRVERPVKVVINISKRLRLLAGQRLLPDADEREPEDWLHQRRRKPKVEITLIEDNEEDQGEEASDDEDDDDEEEDEDQRSEINNLDRRARIRELIKEDEYLFQNEADGQLSQVQVQEKEGSDQESRTQRPWKKTPYYHQSAGRGLVFRRRRPR